MDIVTVGIAVPSNKLGALYAAVAAVLGASASSIAMASGNSGSHESSTPTSASTPVASASNQSAPTSGAATQTAPTENTGSGDGERDAAGVLWSADKHASTKGKTTAGLWRMKVGVSRPEGEGLPSDANSATAQGSSASANQASGTTAPANVADEDEFAAFRAAAGTPSAAQARSWTDADLSKLCNQAAIKAGGPDPVKVIIAKFVPEGQPQHSRSIPNENREAFARDVETSLGITYEG